MDAELSEFYVSLLKSESRHFMDYITLAKTLVSPDEVDERLSVFSAIEQDLIEGPDTEVRFHSGVLER